MKETTETKVMTSEDKLAKLLKDAKKYADAECKKHEFCVGCTAEECENSLIAKYLIQNGACIPEWIDVQERLPFDELQEHRKKYTTYPYFNVMLLGSEEPMALMFTGKSWRDGHFDFNYNALVTHWQPMPASLIKKGKRENGNQKRGQGSGTC